MFSKYTWSFLEFPIFILCLCSRPCRSIANKQPCPAGILSVLEGVEINKEGTIGHFALGVNVVPQVPGRKDGAGLGGGEHGKTMHPRRASLLVAWVCSTLASYIFASFLTNTSQWLRRILWSTCVGRGAASHSRLLRGHTRAPGFAQWVQPHEKIPGPRSPSVTTWLEGTPSSPAPYNFISVPKANCTAGMS